MHESGLMTKWISEQIPSKDKCSDSSTNQVVEERKVNVSDMQGIFFVLFMGNVFARANRTRNNNTSRARVRRFSSLCFFQAWLDPYFSCAASSCGTDIK